MTLSQDNDYIPVIWSSYRCSCIGSNDKSRGINFGNITLLKHAPLSSRRSACTTTAKMALVNARSISNKSFILNDFFTSHSLDFLFITETWLKHGDLMPLVEIAPLDCAFFSSPRASGHGGGVATIFRSCFKCKTVPLILSAVLKSSY